MRYLDNPMRALAFLSGRKGTLPRVVGASQDGDGGDGSDPCNGGMSGGASKCAELRDACYKACGGQVDRWLCGYNDDGCITDSECECLPVVAPVTGG